MRTHLVHRPARDIIPPLGGARVSFIAVVDADRLGGNERMIVRLLDRHEKLSHGRRGDRNTPDCGGAALPPKADIACDPGKSAKCQQRTSLYSYYIVGAGEELRNFPTST